MKQFDVELGHRSYPIHIGRSALNIDLIHPFLRSEQIMIVTNETVAPLYLNQLTDLFGRKQVQSVILPDGERYKTLETMDLIYRAMLTHRFGRDAMLIALGGGVIGDMTGFAAATYQRGIDFIQIPTTLLAQVDSSVGGKTGVNHALGKNMIGAFYQPKCVLIDPQVLSTLPDRELSAGLAEVIKYGAICDPAFFDWLETNMAALIHRDADALATAIERSCRNKAEVVAQDEFESGRRAILNFGHTFGHAIETGLGYGEWLHGDAVAAGMCQAAHMSQQLGWITGRDVERLVRLCERAHLPVAPPSSINVDRYIELMKVDKKNRQGTVRLVLLESLGNAVLYDATDLVLIRNAIQTYDCAHYLDGQTVNQ